ncbi:LytR/AlgR family response regulator transcription factor [Rufibacter sediminis]|uniref:LytTR family transcriptional regulator DNA-binding domain-containing protein n=1 Tax=Rufibacter sediminis TaxID=2762756 RepID=A0ABR6VX44_9BACT|nr:LytTR family transcriptional regulator DNA-binding domain-containing protein [Rufibacter sediminis]MBC3541767.1 LytTR family transcriptional regulator DNA-binding domain-containing protein [Rufibacter sediminis]
MKICIVEDSRLARLELKHLLSKFPELELIGEAENAEDGIALIESLRPDLLFLDIHLPQKSGFELLEALEYTPQVIFTTAYDQYALKAFERNALDYLMKPIEESRLRQAVEKAMTKQDVAKPIAPSTQLSEEDRVFVKDGERCWFVALKQVRMMESNGNYAFLYFENERPCILKTLNYLESRLDPKVFFRANRQQIINVNFIEQINPWFSGSIKLQLKGGEEVEVSRRQTQVFKELMSL